MFVGSLIGTLAVQRQTFAVAADGQVAGGGGCYVGGRQCLCKLPAHGRKMLLLPMEPKRKCRLNFGLLLPVMSCHLKKKTVIGCFCCFHHCSLLVAMFHCVVVAVADCCLMAENHPLVVF